MSEIFVTSDTHFCHDKLFLWQPRGFANQWEMNEAIIENWNKLIKRDDIVYHLGDMVLSDTEGGKSCVSQLNGKIHWILGNHDTDSKIERLKQCHNIVSIERVEMLKIGKKSLYLCHYPTIVGNFDDDKKYPTYCLCGHSHTKDKWLHKEFNCYHCELDAHNNCPVNLDEIMSDIHKMRSK